MEDEFFRETEPSGALPVQTPSRTSRSPSPVAMTMGEAINAPIHTVRFDRTALLASARYPSVSLVCAAAPEFFRAPPFLEDLPRLSAIILAAQASISTGE